MAAPSEIEGRTYDTKRAGQVVIHEPVWYVWRAYLIAMGSLRASGEPQRLPQAERELLQNCMQREAVEVLTVSEATEILNDISEYCLYWHEVKEGGEVPEGRKR